MIDIHTKQCTCSYCHGETKLHYGLNIPPAWNVWNSWYVIKFWKNSYIRWTHSFLKRPEN